MMACRPLRDAPFGRVNLQLRLHYFPRSPHKSPFAAPTLILSSPQNWLGAVAQDGRHENCTLRQWSRR